MGNQRNGGMNLARNRQIQYPYLLPDHCGREISDLMVRVGAIKRAMRKCIVIHDDNRRMLVPNKQIYCAVQWWQPEYDSHTRKTIITDGERYIQVKYWQACLGTNNLSKLYFDKSSVKGPIPSKGRIAELLEAAV